MDRVYIIESPSQQDLAEDRMEGKALSAALTLARCDNAYKLVNSIQDFKKAIDFIIIDFYEKKGKWSAMPFIHISANGNEDGIGLTNGEFLEWSFFKNELDRINSQIGFVPHFTEYSDDVSRIVLCFSSCKGYNGIKIFDKKDTCPFQCLVGPKNDIDWFDSLTGFITFYHLANNRETAFADSVKQMNASAGLTEVFELYVSPEVGKLKPK